MGESGENSNDWIKSARELFEKNEIGWSFWNYKKIKQGDGGGAVAVY